MHLPDPAASRAVLIGVHAFDYLDQLAAVANNLSRLQDALTDPGLWGLPKEHCLVIPQPRYHQEVVDAIAEAADKAKDTLFVYYAGHGLFNEQATDPSDRLWLALPGSDNGDRLHWALPYTKVREKVQQPRRARRKVVVLDCCFSGQAAVAMGPSDLKEEAAIEGAYVLASCGARAQSYVRKGAELTDFTGELMSLIEEGVPGGPELLTVEDLFQGIRRAALHKRLATPHKLATDTAEHIALVRNRAWVAELPPASPPTADGHAQAVPQLGRVDLERLVETQKGAADSFPYEDLLEAKRRPRFTEVYVRQQMSAQGMDGEHHGERGSDPSRPGDWSRSREREERRAEAGTAALEGKQDRRVSQSLKSVLESPEHLLITGGPGMGKSSLISQLPRELPENAVPIRVTAKHLAPHAVRHKPWQEAIAAAAEEHMLPAGLDRLPDRPTPDGRWVVLIDALDEVSDVQARDRLVDWVDGILTPQDLPFRLILTSRPPTPADRHKLIRAGMVHYTLEPFTADGLERFARGWFHDSPVPGQADRFLAQLRDGHLLDVAKVPLLATIAAIVFENSPDTPLPKQRFDLYEEFLTHLAEGRGKRVREGLRVLLEDLPRGGQLVDQIRERRSRLGERLAVAASRGETDLLSHAESWIRQLAQELGAAIPKTPRWRRTLFSLAEYTGLVTRDGDNVRFWHLSFAEHIAAEFYERDLPDAFDPEAEIWGTWLARIFDGTGQEEVARLVLVRHTQNHPDSGLLPWLQQRTDHHQALVGELLLRGARATGPVLTTFCGVLRRVLFVAGDEGYDDMLTTAALLGDPGVSATLASVMEDESAPTTARVASARLLTERSGPMAETAVDYLWTVIDDPHIAETDRVRGAAAVARTRHPSRDRAAAVLLTAARDERLDFPERHTAAEALASLGGDCLADAQACLADLMQTPGIHAQQLVTVAEALVKLSPTSFDDALSALEGLAERPATSVADRIDLMRIIAVLDRRRRPRSIDVLGEIMASPRTSARRRAHAAVALADLAPDRADLAKALLRNLIGNSRLSVDDRIEAADGLVRVNAAQRTDMADELFRLAKSPHGDPRRRADAAVKSASFAPLKKGRCVDLLATVATDPAYGWSDRLYAVSHLSTMDPQNIDRCVPVLEGALANAHVEPHDRAKAADLLGKLSDGHRASVIEVLRGRITARGTPLREILPLARSLAQLAPERIGEVEAVLTQVLESPFINAGERRDAAEALAALVPRARPRVVAALLGHAAEEPDWFEARWSLITAVEIDPGQREAAVRILHTRLIAPSEPMGNRMWFARTLSEVGGAQERTDVTRVLTAHVTDAAGMTPVRLAAADALATIAPKALESVVDDLLAIAADESCPANYRRLAATRIGGLGRDHHDRAQALLEAIVTDERCDITDREKAQEELQNLRDVPPPVTPASS